MTLGNNLTTSSWQAFLGLVANDWAQSTVLDPIITTGSTRPKSCKPALGRIEVCNARYGFNGWLGLARIWVSGEHIVQGTAKVNDSYFDTRQYNDPNARRHVLCQEIGHTLGLDHSSSASCMNDGGASLFDPDAVDPDSHDYEELEQIYAHLDSASLVAEALEAPAGEAASDEEDEIPPEVRRRRIAHFSEPLPGGIERITFVEWAN